MVKTELHAEGIIKGVITEDPHGVGGFGYDSIFKPEFFDKTFAEMDKKKKTKSVIVPLLLQI